MISSEPCPFCDMPYDRILHVSENGMVVRDGYPVSRGHSLIIPKHHYPDFFSLPEHIRNELFQLIDTAKAQLDDELDPDGYNIGINSGGAAGQTVPHLHIHLIPRFAGDMDDPRGGVRWIFPEKAKYWA